MKKYGWKKRLLALAMSIAVGVTAVPFAAMGTETVYAADTLKGVSENHWARASMQKMYDQGILSGDARGNMHPNRAVTRAEFISMLNRALNYTQYDSQQLPFTDMTGEEWYATHIRVAYSQGYFSGVAPNRAGATEPITREAAAAMLCRNVKIESNTLQLTQFTDGTSISQWSRGSVGAAVDKGYMKGYEDGTFRPKNNISRAEAATMLSNALGTILSQSGTYSGLYDGNVTLTSSNVTLKDAVISGDLYITEGVGTGYANLDNVTVLGEVIVCGGGEGRWGGNSVEFKNCTIQKLTVDGPDDRPVSLYATGNTTIAQTNVKSDAYLQNHADTVPGFDNIRLIGPEDTNLYLSGNFKRVDVINPKNNVTVGKGEVAMLTVDEDAAESTVQLDRGVVVKTLNVDGKTKVKGKGDIEQLVVTTNDSTIEQLPDQIQIRPGATAEVNGKDMTSMDAEESSTSPRITAGYPKAKEIASTQAKVLFAANKPGTIYWAMTYNDVNELNREEILKPTTVTRVQQSGSVQVTDSAQELTVALTKLEANAQFTVSAVLVDGRNDVSLVKDVVFRTSDNTVPGFVQGYPVTVPHSSHRFDIEAMPTKDGTIYWAVFPKGATAPTVYQLRSQNLKGAIVYGKREGCERNVSYILTAENDKLVEQVTYDVYVMVSDGERESAIVKLAGVTKDTTPPEFLDGTPLQDKNDAKSVNVRVTSNEEGKVYYVVTRWDEKFPVPIVVDGKLEQPALDSKEAQQQVVTGNNAFIAGSANVKAETAVTVNIKGLEEETPYHVYMVLEDKSGNLSVVKALDIKTKDVTPPTAMVTCDNPIDGKMPVEEPIKIVFSEIVWNALSTTGGEEPNEGNLSREVIRLYDVTLNQEEEVAIDFKKVKNEVGENGATVLVFPPECFDRGGGSFGLSSGSRYLFRLNNIMDTSGNYMKKDTDLEIFQTVPPLVVLTETADRQGMDYTFSLKPQSKQTSDFVLFDMLLQSDHNIGIELYGRKSVNDGFTQITAKGGDTTFALGANKLTSLHSLLDNDVNGLQFDKFNTLPDYQEYGIKIIRIDGDTVKSGWHTTVRIDVTCVAGQYAKLAGLFNGMTQPGDGDVSNVNYSTQDPKDSTKFVMEIPFIDNIVPSFISGTPVLSNDGLTGDKLQITDVLIRPQLMTDRKATMYYLITPKGTLNFEKGTEWTNSDTPDAPRELKQEALNKRAQNIQAFAYKTDDSFWGAYEITEGQVLEQPKFPEKGDLEPDSDYEMFMVLKGVPERLSQVYYRSFHTQTIAPPQLKATVISRGEKSAELEITAQDPSNDKRALVDWIVLRQGEAEQFRQIGSAEVQARIIRNRQESVAYRPVAYGGGTLEWDNSTSKYSMRVTVDGIERLMYYVLIGVSKMALSDNSTVGADSAIFYSAPFTATDMTPPKLEFKTNYSYSDLTPTIIEKDGYKGTLYVSSTEPLYYLEIEGQDPKPVNEEILTNNLVKSMNLASGDKFAYVGCEDQPLYDENNDPILDSNGNQMRAVTAFTLRFKEAFNNSYTSMNLRFCDANGNVVDRVSLTFRDRANENVDTEPNYAVRASNSKWEESYSAWS